MAISISFLILSLSGLLALLSLPQTLVIAGDSNVLLTGDVLTTDGQLSYGNTAFIIQDDCNLVLYNNTNGFQSNTHSNGLNCTLTLNDHGQLIITSSADGSTVWTSGSPSPKKGNYAAVLRPDGQVAVYGPSVWSTPEPSSSSPKDIVYESELDGNIPMVRNLLFSSQTLYNGASLATRDYSLVMQEDCNLKLRKANYEGTVWQSSTAGKGKHCFLRLDHRGQLVVADDRYKAVWN